MTQLLKSKHVTDHREQGLPWGGRHQHADPEVNDLLIHWHVLDGDPVEQGLQAAARWSSNVHRRYLRDYHDADWRPPTLGSAVLQVEATATVGIAQSDDAEGIGSVREETAEPANPSTVSEAYGPLGALLEYEQDQRQRPYPRVVTGTLHLLDDQPLNREVSIDGFHAEVAEMAMPMVRQLADTIVTAELINNPEGWWWLHNIEPVDAASEKQPDDLAYQQVHGWRSMQPADLEACRDWIADAVFERLRIGRERYRSDRLGFQGDPLEQAIEEWLDEGVYLFWERRRRSEERYAIDDRILVLLWQSYCDGLPPPHDSEVVDDFVYWLTHQDPTVDADELPALREAWRRFVDADNKED